jgi:ATP-dependent DNA helicase RecG
VLAVTVKTRPDTGPFVYDGRPYERVASTTRRMAQTKYDKRLLDRAHATWRWEDEPVGGLTLKDLDRKEILRTRELAIQHNRISVDTSRDIGEILDRLGLRVGGVLTRASLMLYGKQFLPHYPQCLLKMGRFRGTEITGEIVDNRQEYMNAFAMVREGMAFLERTMPLGARFPPGQIFREDRFPVTLDALREILLNAVMHRDYSHYSGYVAIVVFDDRIEIRSYGCLPSGITVKKLSGKHDSKPVNPLIAGAFHRTGAVWGRGTNRVIDMCRQHGAALPVFEEFQGLVHVTFNAAMVPIQPELELGSELESKLELELESLDHRVLATLREQPLGKSPMAKALGQRQASGPLHQAVRALLAKGLIERTIPDKPMSRLQKYLLTPAGEQALTETGGTS